MSFLSLSLFPLQPITILLHHDCKVADKLLYNSKYSCQKQNIHKLIIVEKTIYSKCFCYIWANDEEVMGTLSGHTPEWPPSPFRFGWLLAAGSCRLAPRQLFLSSWGWSLSGRLQQPGSPPVLWGGTKPPSRPGRRDPRWTPLRWRKQRSHFLRSLLMLWKRSYLIFIRHVFCLDKPNCSWLKNES